MAGTMQEVDQFFPKQPAVSFVEPFGKQRDGRTAWPARYINLIASDESEPEVTGYVHLFVGPGCNTRAYHVVLGTHGSAILGGASFVHSHFYEYNETQTETGKAGTVREVVVEIGGQRRFITGRFKTGTPR